MKCILWLPRRLSAGIRILRFNWPPEGIHGPEAARITQFGSKQKYDVVLNLLCATDSGLAGVLKRHSRKVTLAAKRKVGDGGMDMSYRLLLRDPSRSYELQTELEETEGVQRVSLFMREDESEV